MNTPNDKKSTMTFSVPEPLKRDLQRIAATQRTTVTSIIIAGLTQILEQGLPPSFATAKREGKKIPLSLFIPAPLKYRLLAAAKEHGSNRSTVAVYCLEHYLGQHASLPEKAGSTAAASAQQTGGNRWWEVHWHLLQKGEARIWDRAYLLEICQEALEQVYSHDIPALNHYNQEHVIENVVVALRDLLRRYRKDGEGVQDNDTGIMLDYYTVTQRYIADGFRNKNNAIAMEALRQRYDWRRNCGGKCGFAPLAPLPGISYERGILKIQATKTSAIKKMY